MSSLVESGCRSLNVLPKAICDADRFVRWKEVSDASGGHRKTPVNPFGRAVGYSDPAATVGLDEAQRLILGSSKHHLGITLLDGLPIQSNSEQGWLWCLDFDGFADACSSNLDDGVVNFLNDHSSYAEVSPSKTGLKYFFISDRDPATKFKIRFGPSGFLMKYPEVRKYEHREVEVFSKNCFLALTSDVLNGSPSALMFIGGDQFDTLVDTLNQWALDTGGSGLDRAKEQGSVGTTASSDNTHRYSKLTSSSLKKVLGCINHADEGAWTKVANILTRVYGSQGRENFHAFSRGDLCGHPYKKYTESECNDRFDRALADLKNRPSGYGVKHLLSLAREHGGGRESDVVYESEFGISDLFLKEVIVEQDEHPVSTEQAGGIPSNIDRMDIRNGERFREQYHRKIAFVRDTGDVLRYELDAGWVRGNSDLPLQAAKAVVTKMVEAYGNAMMAGQGGGSMLSEIKRASSRRALEDMIKLAKSEPGMSVSMSDLDKDPYLLGVKNGVVDLRSGLLLQANPDLLVTKRCNVEYDPDAKCPRFCAFLDQVVPDKAQRDFLVIVLGYFLTGLVKEQLWFFFHGVGSNGKSVLISVLENLMGDYVTKIQTEMLMQQNRSSAGAAPDLLRLQGKRLVFCNETKEGQRLDDARIKDLTGGDTITGRPLYSNNHVSFQPTHKLVVVGNYHPVVSDDSHGFWRRVVVYPFSVCIPQQNQNKDLVLHLNAEGAGILNHLLKALKVYFEQGLLVPESLSKATMVYRDDQDLIEQFLTDNCVRGRDKTIIKTDLYCRYKNWCISNGLYALASNRFSRKLNAKGFEVSADKRTWVGVA